MTQHPLSTIDPDKCLPKKKWLYHRWASETPIVLEIHGYNTRCQEEEEIAIEINVEALARTLYEHQYNLNVNRDSNIAHWNEVFLPDRKWWINKAQAIADNKDCYKLTRVK